MLTIEKKKVSGVGWKVLFKADYLSSALSIFYLLRHRFPHSRYRIMYICEGTDYSRVPINVTAAARKEGTFKKVS